MKAMKESSDPKHNELILKYESKMNNALDEVLKKNEFAEKSREGDVSELLARPSNEPAGSRLHEPGAELDIKVWQDPKLSEVDDTNVDDKLARRKALAEELGTTL